MTTPSLNRLATTFDIHGWYDRVRQMGRPVAWCSAFAPAEALIAAGVVPIFPENHAAMLGAISPERDPDQPFSRAAITRAETAGHTAPRLCSYALADLGVLAGAASPLGALPDPDLFYACDSQCAVVGRWGADVASVFAQRGRTVPHYLLHAPPLRGAAHHPAELARFATDLRGHCDVIAQSAGTRFDLDRLTEVVAESARANRLWQECLELGRVRPAPWTFWDACTAMAPIVIARGWPEATAYYTALREELRSRVTAGFAAVPNERYRVLWDAIPIWPRRRWLAEQCAARGISVVASTYTHSWWFELDPARAWDGLIERYAWNTMNREAAWVLEWTLGLVRDYHCDGILAHWNASCGIWNSYVKRRLPGFAAAGVPCTVLRADMVDARAFDATTTSTLLDTFVSTLSHT